ncbi:MAG: PhoX family phosphatase [Betaproteobacteria bacterium]|nr:PhoX family phosphatase [Betaproteobacteria bacterium]
MKNTCFDPVDRNTAALATLADPFRRRLLSAAVLATAGGTLAATGLPLPSLAAGAGRAGGALLPFAGIAPSTEDRVVLPTGYRSELLFAWGDPVSDGPRGRADASDSALDQGRQAGMHHDGMHFFPAADSGSPASDHGLLCINHEYTDDGLLHPGGMRDWSAEKVAKSKAATGVSVIEVRRTDAGWRVVRPSRWARRITADTPCRIAGPARGHPALTTAADRRGEFVLGTLNNCAMGATPWGTYLTCEENFNGYFRGPPVPGADQQRYGINEKGFGFRWHEFDERFDATLHPNEPNRFGWVVEIDPWQPHKPPVKRTALGRFKHEGATVTLARDRRVVVYMGDDERFEYIYKFVSRRPYLPGRGDTSTLLDEGTLYVARFDEDGKGRWLPLRHGERYPNGALSVENGFAGPGDVVIRCRQAADLAGATKMDRPEWIAVAPTRGDVYVTLTNNSQRGTPERPGLNAANPRPANIFGHIVRWREGGSDAAATRFAWDIFALAGDPQNPDAAKRGNIKGDPYGSPDGLWFDAAGRLWIQTDVSTGTLNKGDYANFGNNQMLVADPTSGATRRFMSGPNGCEITGITASPDGRTLFVNIQHPGESPGERGDPEKPTAISAWPANQYPGAVGGRPRSATIAITREDGYPVAPA